MTATNSVAAVAAQLLRDADALGTFPTPVDDIVTAAGLIEADDYLLSPESIRDAPPELRTLLESAAPKVLGLVDRREGVIHVDPSVTLPARRAFITLHEASHHAIPWQQALLYADDEESLSPAVRLAFEREANACAADLLFQIDTFDHDARSAPVSHDTVDMLAGIYGASFRAAFRRYGERHTIPVLAATFGRWPVDASVGVVERMEASASEAWRSRMPIPRWPRWMDVATHPLAIHLATPGVRQLRTKDKTGAAIDLEMSVRHTRWNTFALLTPA